MALPYIVSTAYSRLLFPEKLFFTTLKKYLTTGETINRMHMAFNSSLLPVFVASEVGNLKRLLIHSPDRGLGKVIPSKAQDWLFEDIVHLDTMRRQEYDYYLLLLLWFLDPAKIRGRMKEIETDRERRFFKPGGTGYFKSDFVLEFETLLSEVLDVPAIRSQLTASICGIERCSYRTQEALAGYDTHELARIFISGTLPDKSMLFAPLPNLIFTRDIGIVIKDFILLNKPAKNVRTRESLLAQYVFYNHPVFERYRDKILELPDNEHHFLLADEVRNSEYNRATLEGGDVMVVAPEHLLIGCSERTSLYAVQQCIRLLFDRGLMTKISVIKIPKKRDYMHIDTLFTQVKRNVWVLLHTLARHGDQQQKRDVLHFFAGKQIEEEMSILQFRKGEEEHPRRVDNLEDLLEEISREDLGCTEKVQFIYSGNREFPFNEREQWTDSCNVLALKDGVVLGYDRNDNTLEAFRQNGFATVHVKELLAQFEAGTVRPEDLTDTLVMLPSAELSRARGGYHCMSMPLWREGI